MKQSELALLRRGKRWFSVQSHPGWVGGDVVRLRASGQSDPFIITITEIIELDDRYKVHFKPGDSRPEDLYIAEGWPDYTSDPFRAMRGELPPMPETMEERKSRTAWLALALRHTAEPPRVSRRRRRDSQTRRERVVYAAGSPEAIRVVRLWTK